MESKESIQIEKLKQQVEEALHGDNQNDFTYVYNTLKNVEQLFEILETRSAIIKAQDYIIERYEKFVDELEGN